VPAKSFAGANVSGLFFVSMNVLDQQGQRLPQISQSTHGARHVVSVENYSTLSQNAWVVASLPHGTSRIEFVDSAGQAAARWDKQAMNIPTGTTVDLECPLRRNNGSNHPNEPIQCDDVQDAQGSLAWASGTKGVPFTITILAT
jgi:hypothetical protein